MNINPQEFLNTVLNSLSQNVGKVDYSKLLDEAVKNGNIFNTNGNYGNYGNSNNTSIFNAGTPSTFGSSSSQQAKPQNYEQYSQRTAQILANVDQALSDLEKNNDTDTETHGHFARASTLTVINAISLADEIDNAASNATGTDKSKLKALANQIREKVQARDTKFVALNEAWCKMANDTMIEIKSPEAVIAETQTAQTAEQIADAIKLLEKTKADYKTELERSRAISHKDDEGSKNFIDSETAKIDARINELKSNIETKQKE